MNGCVVLCRAIPGGLIWLAVLFFGLFFVSGQAGSFDDFDFTQIVNGRNVTRSKFKEFYPRFHQCFDEGEAYAASYLTSMTHFLQANATPGVGTNTESATFIMLETKKRKKHLAMIGTHVQTRDMADLSVIHLSAYERALRKFGMRRKQKTAMERLQKDLLLLEEEFRKSNRTSSSFSSLNHRYLPEEATLAVLPWLGLVKGAGNSRIENRLSYLTVCFWSIYRWFPHVVIGVDNQLDLQRVESLGLPLHDLILVDEIDEKHELLPVATLRKVQKHIKQRGNGDKWKGFDYLFFSESDQILLASPTVFSGPLNGFKFLSKYPRTVIMPHRLMPYPAEVLRTKRIYKTHLQRVAVLNPLNFTVFKADDTVMVWPWSSAPKRDDLRPKDRPWSCLMPKESCLGDRSKGWTPLGDKNIPLIKLGGMVIPMGNANFQYHEFLACEERERKPVFPM